MNEGILLVDKPAGITSFRLVAQLRRLTGVRKIGHAGTLDPFATGLMVMLIGRSYTRLSDRFLTCDKEYEATLRLGITTDTYDNEGEVVATSDSIPPTDAIHNTLERFQGEIEQIPPMFSAKKQGGRKLYELARKGETVERKPVPIHVKINLLAYTYPELKIRVACSKGTYIRSLGHDIGEALGCGAHLSALRRTRSGTFTLNNALDGAELNSSSIDLEPYLLRSL